MGGGHQRRQAAPVARKRPALQTHLLGVRPSGHGRRKRLQRVRGSLPAHAQDQIPERGDRAAQVPAGELLQPGDRRRRAGKGEAPPRGEEGPRSAGRRPRRPSRQSGAAARHPGRGTRRGGLLPAVAQLRLPDAVPDGGGGTQAALLGAQHRPARIRPLLQRRPAAGPGRPLLRGRRAHGPMDGPGPDLPPVPGRGRRPASEPGPAQRRALRRAGLPRHRDGLLLQREAAHGHALPVDLRRRRRPAAGELRPTGRGGVRLGLREPAGLPAGSELGQSVGQTAELRPGRRHPAQGDRLLLHAPGAGARAGRKRPGPRHGRTPGRRRDQAGESGGVAGPAGVRPRLRLRPLPAGRRPPHRP